MRRNKKQKQQEAKGVTRSYCVKHPWKAQIVIFGKVKYLGLFKTLEEASEAYQNKLSNPST